MEGTFSFAIRKFQFSLNIATYLFNKIIFFAFMQVKSGKKPKNSQKF